MGRGGGAGGNCIEVQHSENCWKLFKIVWLIRRLEEKMLTFLIFITEQ